MKPDVKRFIDVTVGHLMTKTAQQLPSSYEQANVFVIASMLGAVGQEFERAAARRVEENNAMRRLFADAVSAVEDVELRSKLGTATRGSDDSLLVSDLQRTNDALRRLLIDLHAHIEEIDSPDARRIERDIWVELAASTDRRNITLMGIS